MADAVIKTGKQLANHHSYQQRSRAPGELPPVAARLAKKSEKSQLTQK